MAKGNMLLGKSRGSVGDVTFSQINGQQIAKARNRNPANPRTLKQCFQRARFAAAVKFYTRGTQALYKFAFENKRQVESDYNAFMRNNVKIAPAISKAAFDNSAYPVIAPFVMAKGSLASLSIEAATGAFNFKFGLPAQSTEPTTIGQLSALLIELPQFQVGDILTFVYVNSNYDGTIPSVEAEGKGNGSWTIKQMIIDTTSTESIASAIDMTIASSTDETFLTHDALDYDYTGTYQGCVVIHSRETAQGLKVSTQELVLNAAAATAFEASQADAYKEAVAVSWRTAGAVDMEPDAILQGSIAYGQQ